MKQLPIIFCHYGFSKYLPYVFKCAKISNPNKEIILLGDESNKKVATDCGVTHVNLKDYDYGEEISIFDKSYKLITSPSFDSFKHGEDWNKFVFRKWFILYNFIMKNQIEKFWHFDSDNMILTDLSKVENRFIDIDFTEQSHGNCIKGYFGNSASIKRYIDKINDVFSRKDLIDQIENEMLSNQFPCCFSEMSIYGIFKEEEKYNTTRLADIVEDSFFDDLICRSEGMIMEKLPMGEDVKVVHLNPDGRFFCIDEITKKPVLAYILNLSWIPIYIFDGVLKHLKNNHKKPEVDFDPNSKTLSQISPPLKQRLKFLRKKIKSLLKRKK